MVLAFRVPVQRDGLLGTLFGPITPCFGTVPVTVSVSKSRIGRIIADLWMTEWMACILAWLYSMWTRIVRPVSSALWWREERGGLLACETTATHPSRQEVTSPIRGTTSWWVPRAHSVPSPHIAPSDLQTHRPCMGPEQPGATREEKDTS